MQRGLWIFLALFAAAAAATAQPLVIDGQQTEFRLEPYLRYWVEDGTALGVADLAATETSRRFEEVSVDQRFDIHNKALWLRFDLTITDTRQRWYLELERPGLDLAELYYVDANGQWVSQAAGDALPMRQWARASRYPVFALAPPSALSVRYYLRVQHQRMAYSAPMVIASNEAIGADHERDHLLLGAYFGVAIFTFALALAMALTYRDEAFTHFALLVATLTFSQTATTGIGGQYLWPASPYWANAFSFLLPQLLAASALWFVRAFAQPKRFAKWLDHAALALIALALAGGAVDTIFPTALAVSVNYAVQLACVVVLLVLLGTSAYEGDRHVRWLCWGFLPVMVASAFPLLRNAGVLATSTLTSYALLIGATVQAPVVFYALYHRLTERRESDARTRALSQVDPLTGLTQRRVFEARLEASVLRAQRYGQQCALLLVDLTNHGQVLRSHGREAADRAMVVAASRLRKAVRDIDTAARLGDHQFALLIEAPATGQEALAVATHAVAMALRSSAALPEGESLKLHMVVALLPDASSLQPLAWMEAALSSMDDKSLKAIRTLNF